jgi:hypothetical protein
MSVDNGYRIILEVDPSCVHNLCVGLLVGDWAWAS